MRQHTLRATLLRHWISFAVLTGLFTVLSAGIVAYVVEDRLIDGQLKATANELGTSDFSATDLPPGFTLHPSAQAHSEIEDAFAGTPVGEPTEYWSANGTYFHAIAIQRNGSRDYLLFDASDTLVVHPNLATTALVALACVGFFVVIAALVANGIGRLVAKRSERLLGELQQCRTPEEVSLLAEQQEISEICAFLKTHAEVWHKRTQAVREQENTVSFLAHELRTPLQSARASIAVIRDDVPTSAALDRLDRAISRLTRASQATLFIGAEVEQLSCSQQSVFAVWDDLRSEYAPLAAQRGQRIVAPTGMDAMVIAPREALEATIANLLGNAITHGAAGEISLEGFRTHFVIRNPVSATTKPGFGLGMTIVERLLEKLGLKAETIRANHAFEVRILSREGV